MPTLNFKGKTFVQNHHLTVPYHELVPQPNKSVSDEVRLDDNLIVHGDNLVALKALLPMYAGKVKCIYIDPPYNTGEERWIYNDSVNSPMMLEWLGNVVDKDDLTRHDKWLCMMMPRLQLLRELLREDGVLLVSCDDNEQHHLRMLIDEIFGDVNFISCMIWEKTRKNDSRFISNGHDYILIYARNKEFLRESGVIWREAKPGAKEIQEEYLRLKIINGEDYSSIEEGLSNFYGNLPADHPSKKLARYKNVDKKGVWRDDNMSWPTIGGPRYEVVHPVTHQPCAIPDNGWRYSTLEKMNEMINKGVVEFRDDHTMPPIRKTYLLRNSVDSSTSKEDEQDDIGSQVMGSYFYKSLQPATKVIRSLFGQVAFENPKDHEVLARLISYMTDPGDIILDSFAGSGTTGHAVLHLNNESGLDRKFILVEMEDYADSLTAERIRRVIRGVREAKDPSLRQGLGGTFSYFELGNAIDVSSLITGENLPSYKELARYVFYTATGEAFDIEKIDESRYYIGSSVHYDVYLLYQPVLSFLKSTALNLEFAESIGPYGKKKRLVFAPMKYLDEYYLEKYHIEYAQLPYEIYRFKG